MTPQTTAITREIIESLPEDDPRRVAAYVPSPATDDETEHPHPGGHAACALP